MAGNLRSARMRKFITARARKHKRTARMLAKTIRYPYSTLQYILTPFTLKLSTRLSFSLLDIESKMSSKGQFLFTYCW